MHSPWVLALPFALLCACVSVPDAGIPVEEDRPCASDDDCAFRVVETRVRRDLCRSRILTKADSSRDLDINACGPLPNMTPNPPEPVLACFRGTCVPVRTTR